MTIAGFRSMLDGFDTLPKLPEREATFLEVIGYGRREVPISNCLAWFFNSEEQGHGLGAALVEALFECALEDAIKNVPGVAHLFAERTGGIGSCRADTEVAAPDVDDRTRRIDILLKTDQAIVAIENKVDAALYNDLGAYLRKARDVAQETFGEAAGGGCAGIVLAPHARRFAERAHNDNLSVVDYNDFVQRALRSASPYMLSMPPRAWSMLKEVLDTMMTTGNESDDELRAFLETNEAKIRTLLAERSRIRGALRNRAKVISQIMSDSPSLDAMLVGNGIWKPDSECVAVPWFDLGLSESRRLRLDIVCLPTKTELVWSTRQPNGATITTGRDELQLLRDAGIQFEVHPGYDDPQRYLVGEPVSAHEDRSKIAEVAVDNLNKVSAAIGATSS